MLFLMVTKRGRFLSRAVIKNLPFYVLLDSLVLVEFHLLLLALIEVILPQLVKHIIFL